MIRFGGDDELQEALVEGEKITLKAIIHPAIYWKAVAVLVVAFFLTMAVWQLGMLLGFFGLLLLGYAIIKKNILLLALSNKRVLARYGVLQVDVVNMHFDKIESMELERMLPGYLFGYSNVVIMGTGNRFLMVPYVANGPEFRKAFNEMTLSKDKSKS